MHFLSHYILPSLLRSTKMHFWYDEFSPPAVKAAQPARLTGMIPGRGLGRHSDSLHSPLHPHIRPPQALQTPILRRRPRHLRLASYGTHRRRFLDYGQEHVPILGRHQWANLPTTTTICARVGVLPQRHGNSICFFLYSLMVDHAVIPAILQVSRLVYPSDSRDLLLALLAEYYET